MRSLKIVTFVLFLGGLVAPAFGQYYDQRVLGKSFEQADFFFTPNFLNPYGLGGFERSAPGLVDDPLLDLQLSPALVALDSTSRAYAYLDFRGSRDRTHNTYCCSPYLAYDAALISYPYYYANTRRELEPVVSAAVFFQPLRHSSAWTVGGTYQAIFREEGYYAIPHDIYRGSPGQDFAGTRTLDANVPIEDIYLGEDDMHQRGHFANVFTSYAFTPAIRLGVRAGLVTFTRDGANGNENRWTYFGNTSNSFWHNREGRQQDYRHADVSAGLDVRLAPGTQAGLTLGYLDGGVTQDLDRQSDSQYDAGTIGTGDQWSHYFQQAQDERAWDYDGGTLSAGAHLRSALGENKHLTVYYRFLKEDVDLTMDAVLFDTSNSTWRYAYDQNINFSESHSSVRDVRRGGGTREGRAHRLAGALRWDLDAKTRLSFGANLEHDVRHTQTVEAVDLSLDRYYSYTYNDTVQEAAETRTEIKDLLWNFETRATTVQLPVLIERRLNDTFDLLFGLNRRMTYWKITDETLAIYELQVVTENGVTTRRADFGERFREPTERRSDVQTSLLLGLVVAPAEQFDIRLLLVPSFGDSQGGMRLTRHQWWLGFTLKP